MKQKKGSPYHEVLQDQDFMNRIASTSEGRHIFSCIQCGTCSATCPTSSAMTHTPRKVFAMIRAGLKDEVLASSTPWICASCYKCTVDCPAQIKITDIMYSLKRMGAKQHGHLAEPDIKRFYSIFFGLIKKYGHAHELGLMMRHMALRHPIELFKQTPVGLGLLLKGCLPLIPHRVKDRQGFKNIVKRATEIEEMPS